MTDVIDDAQVHEARDSDRGNFDPDNLVLVTRAELVRLNQRHYSREHQALRPSLLALTRLECRVFEHS
jgi:hypothetical protein